MASKHPEDRLHIPDLWISGFRGIESLTIGRLGRVTLLTGRNAVGKTTVLEAVRIFASRGGHTELSNVLMNRGEHFLITDDDGDRIAVPNVSALFFGRHIVGDGISIGSPSLSDIVNIREIAPTDEQMSLFARFVPAAMVLRAYWQAYTARADKYYRCFSHNRDRRREGNMVDTRTRCVEYQE